MTPFITNISLDETSLVTVTKNRGHLQGISTPTFHLTGMGFSANSSDQPDQLLVGTSICNITGNAYVDIHNLLVVLQAC